MSPDPDKLASIISAETGLAFGASSGAYDDGHRWISLTPEGHDPALTFSIRIVLEWRRLTISFVPGKFAGPLLQAMSAADANARSIFESVMRDCDQHGASILINPNASECRYDDASLWSDPWSRLTFRISRGKIELGTEEGIPDDHLIREWASRFAAAIMALLPLEEDEHSEMDGFPEGAVQKVEVNRYERDRRNRAAALAIHGYSCHACGMDFEKVYGSVAAGYIEVHHVVPVSELSDGYIIDPNTDLVPLCSNCHVVAHRRSPPFSTSELRALIGSADAQKR